MFFVAFNKRQKRIVECLEDRTAVKPRDDQKSHLLLLEESPDHKANEGSTLTPIIQTGSLIGKCTAINVNVLDEELDLE